MRDVCVYLQYVCNIYIPICIISMYRLVWFYKKKNSLTKPVCNDFLDRIVIFINNINGFNFIFFFFSKRVHFWHIFENVR